MKYFYPSNTHQCVFVFEKSDIYSSGFGMIGHIPLSLALDLNPEWEWMTDKDSWAYREDKEKRLKEIG